MWKLLQPHSQIKLQTDVKIQNIINVLISFSVNWFHKTKYLCGKNFCLKVLLSILLRVLKCTKFLLNLFNIFKGMHFFDFSLLRKY